VDLALPEDLWSTTLTMMIDNSSNPSTSITTALPQMTGGRYRYRLPALDPQHGPPIEGTTGTPFKPTTEREWCGPDNLLSFQSIVFQQPYQKYSFEELRLADYNAGLQFGYVTI